MPEPAHKKAPERPAERRAEPRRDGPRRAAPARAPTKDLGTAGPAVPLRERAAPVEVTEPVAPEGEAPREAAVTSDKSAESADAAGAARLAGVLDKLGETAREQQGPAAGRSRARRAADEPVALGKAGQIGVMNDQKAGQVDAGGFLALVKEKLRRMEIPSSPAQMARFKEQGGASGLRTELTGGVEAQKQRSMGDLRAAAAAEPTPAAPRRPAAEPQVDAGPPAPALAARQVLPEPKPGAEIALDQEGQEMESTLARESLSRERLLRANDSRFDALQQDREELHADAAGAPAAYRGEETAYLAEQTAAVTADERQGTAAMRGTRRHAGTAVYGRQQTQMTEEERQRQRIAKELEGIYQTTSKTVDDKLAWLDKEVDDRFTRGESRARESFETYVDVEFRAWKSRRYDGVRGAARWIRDRFRDINDLPQVKAIYRAGQDVYYRQLDATIDDVGTLVDTTLRACQATIKAGHDKVREFLDGLDDGLRALGAEAAEEVLGKLADLKSRVEDHRDVLADKLVQRYQESRAKLDARLEEIRESHRGLYTRVKRKIAAVIDAIRNFRNRLLAVLRRAADVIELILDDPIGFLGNLLRAVKQGFNQFAANIWEHLKQGIFGWLFGTLSSLGIRVPSELTPKSIFGLVLEVLGVTYEHVRERAVRVVGERNVAVVERIAGYLSTLFSEGPAGLWAELAHDLGQLKDTVIDGVREWVVTRIVTAAVTKLVSMFNPVGAIIQAVLTIYNVVRFFIERIDQILLLVEAVVDSVGEIARGRVEAAAGYVERTMGRMVPLVISFLANLLGLGGVADRVRKILQQVRGRVDRAIDKLLQKLARRFLDVVAKVKGGVRNLVEWWKARQSFRQDGELHTLFFSGTAAEAELMLASSPMPLRDYVSLRLQGKAHPGDSPKPVSAGDRETLKKVAALLTKIDGQKNQARGAATQTASEYYKEAKGKGTVKPRSFEAEPASIGQARGEEIAKLLTKVAALLATLSGSGGTNVRPPTRVRWKTKDTPLARGATSTDGRMMFASPLSINPGPYVGSEPQSSAKSPLWETVNQRPNAYIRGHLLNHHLHGPGTVDNMVPIPKRDNTRMSSLYEEKVKEAVLAHNKVLSYSVVAEFRGAGKRNHIPDEQHVPTSMRISARILKVKDSVAADKSAAADPDNWVVDPAADNAGLPQDAILPITLPNDDPVDTKATVERVDLAADNAARRDLIVSYLVESLPGVGKKRAELLVAAKPPTEEALKAVRDARVAFVTDELIEEMRKKNVFVGGGTVVTTA